MICRTDLKFDALDLGAHLEASVGALPLGSSERARHTNRVDEARRLLDISNHFRDNGWPVKAKRFAARALAIIERESLANGRDVVRVLLCLAGARADLADFTRAEADYCRANHLLDLMDNPCSREVQRLRIQTFRGLARVMRAQGRDRQAEALLKEALANAERTFGRKDVDVASTLNDLGTYNGVAGAYEEASRLHHQALAIAVKAVGPNHAQTAAVLHQLGVLECARGRFAVGEGFARRSADILLKTCGPDHPQLAAALETIAALLEGQGRHQEADSLRRQALVMVERWFGADDREVKESASQLAGIVNHAGAVMA
jgi:tetratricopeptide (TPR) repeat protein